MSTFSKLRVGNKPNFAGVPVLVAKVDGSATGVVATLPKGAAVLGGVATAAAIAATVSDGTTTATVTTVTSGTSVDSDDPSTIAGEGVVTITAAAAGDLLIQYILTDSRNGANG